MADTVQLSDQFLLASSMKSDPEVHTSKGKRVVSVDDLANTSYRSGQITIDATSQLNGSSGFASLRESYLTVPYVVSAKNVGENGTTRLSRFACTLKTGVWNVISDLEVELNGKQIVTSNEYKNFWNNIRAQTEHSIADVYKHGAENFTQPDEWYSINYSGIEGNNGDGYANNSVDNAEGLDTTLGQGQEHRSCNDGLFKRLCTATPMIVDAGNTDSTYKWATFAVGAQKQVVQQHGRGVFVETAAATPGAIAGVWVFMLKIRLTDLHPIFKELDLISNPQLKLRYRLNGGETVIAGTQTQIYLEKTTMTSGNTCPIIITSAASNNPMNNVLPAAGSKMSFAFGALQNAHTSTNDISQYLAYTNTRLHIPFYDLIDPRPIINKPIKTVRYLDCYAQYFRDKAGMGIVAGQHNASFNLSLSSSLKNVKYVCMIPFANTVKTSEEAGKNHWKVAHGTEQFQSPFDSSPWTNQPGAAFRDWQVQVGGTNVFPTSHSYDYHSFIDEFSKLGAINGDNSREMVNGLIDIDRWTFAHRVMVADCSRLTDKDVPTAIQVSGTATTSQGSNLMILVVYERSLSYDRLTGEVVDYSS